MNIDKETIAKLEKLAMLKLSDEEKVILIPELEKIISMVAKLGELNTSGIRPMSNVHNHPQELRTDVGENSMTKDQALINSKETFKDFFVVPKVISS